jgi:hypothetical protein
MSVSVTASLTRPVKASIISATITLEGHDAQVLRSMLGALTREERREATGRNGGNKTSQDRARFLVKEIIDALDAQGVTRLEEVSITPPDQQAQRAARRG